MCWKIIFSKVVKFIKVVCNIEGIKFVKVMYIFRSRILKLNFFFEDIFLVKVRIVFKIREI